MARYLFIAQQTLDTWMEQDKIDFENDVMKIKADGRAFKLIEAVRFVAVEGGVPDEAGLVGKVKTTEQLRQMGAERCADSVLYKDIPYKVQEGFIAEVFLRQQKQAEKPRAESHAAGGGGADAAGRPERPAAEENPAAATGVPRNTPP
ncbi:MAG: hypothetical protein D6806_15120, partial [Deltaproteobacteria bacterium]